jgi:cyclophilin family peptidyl-prolyl cis-trans isomerase
MNPSLVVRTGLGEVVIELDAEHAPKTAGNFLEHADARHYDGTAIHRVAAGFVIQGGDLQPKGIRASRIPWERTGLRNVKGTLAMARSGSPDEQEASGSASSQFFVNLRDNASLDRYAFPYVVFGRVLEGMEVVETIGRMHPPGQAHYDGPPTSKVEIQAVTRR